MDLDSFMAEVVRRSPNEAEFHQAVREVAENVVPFVAEHPEYQKARILQRLTEPDRAILFRVAWEDDEGKIRVDRGYRVQFNNAIGPYKGGLRFDPSVTLSVLKFLGFEQVLKNSLTTLPMGGAKGGSNFNPKGKSDSEVMRFCQAFMTELYRHIGGDIDVPAGDIGVGAREIGYLFGQYKRIENQWTGAITGKGVTFGGSLIRTEATGYGCVYFARDMLATREDEIEGKTCVVSGAGNVAQYTAEKLLQLGGRVVTLSDRSGFVHDPEALTQEKLEYVIDLKTHRRGSLDQYATEFGCEFHPGERPWAVTCDLAFPCATQNEIHKEDARTLLENGCQLVCEGANMPATYRAAKLFEEAGILYGPAKAANAGGVAISGLEMTQNAMRLTWTREEVDQRLQEIMSKIHEKCVQYGGLDGRMSYVKGANIAGFVKVADAMLAYGVM
ncbi:MAG: NADP-specific glutamate dehydrogenase [Gemmatimonadota bacterium]